MRKGTKQGQVVRAFTLEKRLWPLDENCTKKKKAPPRHDAMPESLCNVWLFVLTAVCLLQEASPFIHLIHCDTTAWNGPRRAARTRTRLPLSAEELHNETLIIIHVDNVRGKSNFQWTHECLIESTTEWRNAWYPSID